MAEYIEWEAALYVILSVSSCYYKSPYCQAAGPRWMEVKNMRLIDADSLNARLSRNGTPYYTVPDIEKATTVDAEPVVYCKDCKYADKERRNAAERRYIESILFCRNSSLCGDEPLAMWSNDFCSYGVAKERADSEID